MKDSYGTYDGRKEEPLYDCPSCSANDAELERLRADNERYLAALRRIAGELGEFADADGETMVEKIRFLREESERLRAYVARVENVEGMENVVRLDRIRRVGKYWRPGDPEPLSLDARIARAVIAYARGEGK